MKPSEMAPQQREAFHRRAEAQVQIFRYKPAPTNGKPKVVQPLAKGNINALLVQHVNEGGENNLHYHLNSETIWMVLRGKVRFYGPENVVIAELGPEEGLLMPTGARYWFEKVGQQELELLQMVATEPGHGNSYNRYNVEQHKDWMAGDAELEVYEPSGATT